MHRGLGLLALFAVTPALAGDPVQRLPLTRAVAAAQASIAACRARGAHVAVEIKDATGTTVAILVDDGADAGAIAAVRLRNLIVLKYKVASGAIEDRARTDPMLAAEIANDPRAKTAERGALPIVDKGVLIGAYGVAGAADGAADEQCALAGLAKVGLRPA
jgi:uncharacterized protein GlcG (DUF336 family)